MQYLPQLSATLPMVSLLYVGSAALRGAGDTRTPMYVMGLMNVVNAVLSWVLIRGWGPLAPMGVMGAGIAAGVSLLYALLSTGFFAAFPRLMLSTFTNDPGVGGYPGK